MSPHTDLSDNQAFQAAQKLIDGCNTVLHDMTHQSAPLERLEIMADDYLSASVWLREAAVTAHGMAVASLVLMADHYKARGLAQKAFVHQARCRPDFREVARRSGLHDM